MLHQDIMQFLVTEWRRVFLKLREMLCTADIYSNIMQGDNVEHPEDDDAYEETAAVHI